MPQSVWQCVRQSVKLRSPQSAYDRDPSMDAAVALLAFITLQRFVEFIWDRRNTRRLRAAGAVEFGGLHYPPMMLVHAGWLAGLWVFAYDSPRHSRLCRRLSGVAGRPLLGARDPWPTLDDPRHRAARRTPDRKRSIPPAAASELRDRSRRVGAGATGPRASPLRVGVCRPLRWRCSATRPGREFGFGMRPGRTRRRWGPNHALLKRSMSRNAKAPARGGRFHQIC